MCVFDNLCPKRLFRWDFNWESLTVLTILSLVYISISSVLGGHRAVLANVTLCVSAVTQKVCLVSHFLCLLYFFVSKPPHFTRPPWKPQSNVDETKYPAFSDKTSRGE